MDDTPLPFCGGAPPYVCTDGFYGTPSQMYQDANRQDDIFVGLTATVQRGSQDAVPLRLYINDGQAGDFPNGLAAGGGCYTAESQCVTQTLSVSNTTTTFVYSPGLSNTIRLADFSNSDSCFASIFIEVTVYRAICD